MKKKLPLIIIWSVCLATMIVQILIGILWACKNIGAVPGFGDTGEYLALSETFALDEYRPILFPLILRIILKISSFIHVPYQSILYLLQTAVNLIVLVKAIRYLAKKAGISLSLPWACFFAAYIWSLPPLLWFHFSVLTDSFALSALIWMLLGLARYSFDGENGIFVWGSILASYIIQALLRSDRTYSAFVMILVAVFARAIRNLNRKKRIDQKAGRVLLRSVALTIAGLLFVMCINRFTQVPGRNGRITTDASFVLLDRVVWSNMYRNRTYFPEEIKQVISEEEARQFDTHNNQVMYQMAPLLESRVGKEKASEYYRTMAKIVWDHDKKKVIKDIAGNIAVFFFTPQSEFLFQMRKVNISTGWTLQCASSVDADLTMNMFLWYIRTFSLFFCNAAGFATVFIKRIRKSNRYLSGFFIMSLLLALWFGLGDGAPTNDRYALIVIVAWALLWMNTFLLFRPSINKNRQETT